MNNVYSGTGTLDQKTLLQDARRQAGLDDFGSEWFLEPMSVLLESVRKEAHLSPAGIAGQGNRIVNGLVGRLRMIDAIKKHPEILDEKVNVAAVITGLGRTGSTLFHRMLAVAPGFTAIRWWETQNFAQFPGEERGNPVERRRVAVAVMDGYVKAGLMSVHPFAIDEPDEEIIILDQVFVGTMPESAMYVPSYAKWLETYDHHQAYQDLKTILKYLQWQDPTRKGKRWVLKTPGHLGTIRVLLDTFPEAKVIMNHRDPIQTVPSFCSFVTIIHRMNADNVDSAKVGQFTGKQWAGFLKRFTEIRDQVDADRFIDVRYEDLVAAPIEQARRVLGLLGVDMTPDGEAAMKHWLEENARDKRAPHHYTLEEFGLNAKQLNEDFAAYKARFLQ